MGIILKSPAHWIGGAQVVTAAMVVFYFGRVIALVNEQGQITWRDRHYPKFLVEYLIEFPQPQYQWN